MSIKEELDALITTKI